MPGSAKSRSPKPHYVYWTSLNADSKESQAIHVCKLTAAWSDSTRSTVTRDQLEAAIDAAVDLCIPMVSEDYVRAKMDFSENPVILVLTREKVGTPRAAAGAAAGAAAAAVASAPLKAEGFILARKDGDGIILDTICTQKGLGLKLQNFFHALMFENGAKFIKLSGLPQVIPYYFLKHKYEFRKTCAGAPLTDLSEALKTRDYKARPLSTKWLDEYDDRDLGPFIYEKLYKEAKLGVHDEPPCNPSTAPLTKRDFIRHECASQGFTMVKCAPRPEGAGRKTRRRRR